MSAYISIRQHTSHTFVLPNQVDLRITSLTTTADVSVRQRKSAYASIRQQTSADVSIPAHHILDYLEAKHEQSVRLVGTRQHTSAYVSIRHHSPAYVRTGFYRNTCAPRQPGATRPRSRPTLSQTPCADAGCADAPANAQATAGTALPGTQLLRCQHLYVCTSKTSTSCTSLVE
jgi:hypothetical protein